MTTMPCRMLLRDILRGIAMWTPLDGLAGILSAEMNIFIYDVLLLATLLLYVSQAH